MKIWSRVSLGAVKGLGSVGLGADFVCGNFYLKFAF